MVIRHQGRVWRFLAVDASSELNEHLATRFSAARLPSCALIQANVVVHLHFRRPREGHFNAGKDAISLKRCKNRIAVKHADFLAVLRRDHQARVWKGGAVCHPNSQAFDLLFDSLALKLPPPAMVEAAGAATTPRDKIFELRARLATQGHYAFKALGHSMRPWIDNGQVVFLEKAAISKLAPGHVVLCWVPGRQAQDDRLVCHRLVSLSHGRANRVRVAIKGDNLPDVAQFDDGHEAEILAVILPSLDAFDKQLPSGDPVRLLLSLACRPLLALRQGLLLTQIQAMRV